MSIVRNRKLRAVARRLPDPVKARLRRSAILGTRPRWGNLKRLRPFSENYGYDRGKPLDRFYIERFLALHAADVRGRVLEVKDASYSQRYGGPKVLSRDVLDIDPRNVEATIVADLAEEGSLPAAAFDCFILTQTLPYVSDVGAAVRNAWQSLAPGGVLLLAVPTITPIDPVFGSTDRWRWTPAGLESLVERCCAGGTADVVGFGNLIAAAAFLYGLAAEELREDDLRESGDEFVIVTCARVAKPGR